MVNYRPIPPATKRSRMTKDTKIAAAIWATFTPEEQDAFDDRYVVGTLTAEQFVAMFDWHHVRELEISGPDRFTNIVPMLRADHRAHTAKRAPVLAKTRHQRKKEEAHRSRVSDPDYKAAQQWLNREASSRVRKVHKMQSRPFPARQRPMRSKP